MKLWMTFVDEPRPLSWQCNCNLANCRGGFQLENLKKGNLANSRSGNRTGPPCLWPCGDQSATSSPPPPSPCVSLFYPWQCSPLFKLPVLLHPVLRSHNLDRDPFTGVPPLPCISFPPPSSLPYNPPPHQHFSLFTPGNARLSLNCQSSFTNLSVHSSCTSSV